MYGESLWTSRLDPLSLTIYHFDKQCNILHLSFCSQGKRQNFVWERLGKPKIQRGKHKIFLFLYKYRQYWCIKGPFLILSLCNIIVRRTISSYNKQLYFFGWRKHSGVSNAWHGLVGCELFLFQLVFMNCEIILTYELFHVINVLLFISVKFP